MMMTTTGGHSPRCIRIHGGTIRQAALRYDIPEKKILDFSSSVNPLGPSSWGLRAAKKSLSFIERYSDPELGDLRTAIARYFGIKPEYVACHGGSTGLIHLIPRLFKPKKVLIPLPSFSEYAAAAEEAGAEVVPLILHERNGFRIDPIDIAFHLKGVDMVFLGNPNNPTAGLITKNEMMEILKTAEDHGVRIVVDEAFMDFSDFESVLKDSIQMSRVIVLRSFTHFFGMAGLQVGYAVSDTETIKIIRCGQEPWGVSIPGERAAIAALSDWGHIARTRRLITAERERLLSELRLVPGVEFFAGPANFILLKFTRIDVPLLTEKLGRQGILVRDCSSFDGLGSGFIRIAIRTRSENRRLLKILRAILIP